MGGGDGKLKNTLLVVGAGSILIVLAITIYQSEDHWPTSIRETVWLAMAFFAAMGFTAMIE
jgi:hypothetical protein